MTSRAEFIATVRGRLDDSARKETPDIAEWSVTVPNGAERFCAELLAIGGHPRLVGPSSSELRAVLDSILEAAGPGPVLVTDEDAIPHELVPACEAEGREVIRWPDGNRGRWAAAAVGVTSCLWAIAETGSVVLASSLPGGRAVSLLPPVFVCAAPRARLVATTAEAFRLIAAERPDCSNVVIVTGPSKSADIGNELVQGVHGPGEVHVILIDEAPRTIRVAGDG